MTEPIRIHPNRPVDPGSRPYTNPAGHACNGRSFADALHQAEQTPGDIKFSNHAQKRLETRNISLSDDGMARLSQAVEKAGKRGGKESLVLVDDLAFIVNVKERLVITAMDSQNRGEGVFTKIDSVVFADPAEESSSEAGPAVT